MWRTNAPQSAPRPDDNNNDDDNNNNKPTHSAAHTTASPKAMAPPVPTAPTLDHVAEMYFAHCVENPQARFYIDYPARTYHIKPQRPGSAANVSHPYLPSRSGTLLGDWQSTLLWQPVLPPSTGNDALDQQEAAKQMYRRPMTDFDRLTLPHFVWFAPYNSTAPHAKDEAQENSPLPSSSSTSSSSSSSSSSQPPSPNTPRLGFRPYKDILLLDTPFLETYLGSLLPLCPSLYIDNPFSPSSPSFHFLPPTPSARALLRVLYLAAEPLRRATYLTDAQLATLDQDQVDDNDNDNSSSTSSIRHRRRQQRRTYELHDMCLRRRTLARMLVTEFPGLQRIQLVEMAHVPPLPTQRNNNNNNSNNNNKHEFAKWANVQAALAAEHALLNRTHPPMTTTPGPQSSGRHPHALLYNRATEWGLVTPRGDDHLLASPTSVPLASYDPVRSLSRLFVDDVLRARDDASLLARWLHDYERERADPSLIHRRRARHRQIGFSRSMPQRPQRNEQEKGAEETPEEKQRRDVKAESIIMMYFEDRVKQAREAGWKPGEWLDVRHLF